jgi:hypothetical protein
MGDFNFTFDWELILAAAAVVCVAFLTYLAGRMQQFRKQIDEREEAFIKGYNTATTNLFSLATRVAKVTLEAPPMMEPKNKPKPYVRGRHAVNSGSKSTLQKTEQFKVPEKTSHVKK